MPIVAKKSSPVQKKTTAVVIRSLPIETHNELKRRAQKSGTSTEAEMRSILVAATTRPTITPADLLLEFGRKYGPLPTVKRDKAPINAAKFK